MSSSKEGGGKNSSDLIESASIHSKNGDPKIVSILNLLLGAAKQPPRTRVRLKIEDIFYLLDVVREVFKSKSALVEIEVRCFFLCACARAVAGSFVLIPCFSS